MTQDRRPGHEDDDPQKIEKRHDLQEQDEQGDNGAGIDRGGNDGPSITFDRDIPGGQSD